MPRALIPDRSASSSCDRPRPNRKPASKCPNSLPPSTFPFTPWGTVLFLLGNRPFASCPAGLHSPVADATRLPQGRNLSRLGRRAAARRGRPGWPAGAVVGSRAVPLLSGPQSFPVELASGGDAEFRERLVEVITHGPWAEEELSRDVAV